MSALRNRSDSNRSHKLFTVEAANRCLPLVRAIVRDLSRVSSNVAERRQRVSHLMSGREFESGDPYAEELVLAGDELDRDVERIDSYVEELSELGVEVKNASLGWVDFPCELEGRKVYLGWKLGEPDVRFWHEIDASYTDRHPLSGGPRLDQGGA